MRWFILIVIIVCTVSQSRASPEEAAKALAEKQAGREKARAVIVQISAGELEDFQTKIRLLQSQNDALSAKIASLTGAPKPVAHRFTEIEVGMTKDELVTFVNARRSRMKLGMFTTSAGGVLSEKEQV